MMRIFHRSKNIQAVHSHGVKKISGGVDFWLIGIILCLLIIGIIAVYNSSVSIAIRDFHDQYYFVKEQLKWLVVGLILLFITSNIQYRTWTKFAAPMLIGGLILLVLVFVPHIGLKLLGAHRWIKIAFVVIQPAELMKFILVVYLSTWFSGSKSNKFFPFLLLIGLIVLLVMAEPDMGTTTILVGISLILYFISNAPIVHMFLFVPIVIVAFIALAIASPYRFQRLVSFVNPHEDPLGSSYQIRQALIAIGSGGFFGVGLGQSRQKYEYLPEANTDSIFAIMAEETGFIGSTLVVAAYMFLLARGFLIVRKARDDVGRYMAAGITSWIGIQSALNLCAMVSFVPLTGIPLPLISYGGSSLTFTLAALGVLLNISRHV